MDYLYTVDVVSSITENYCSTNGDEKADYDIAVRSIGKGDWRGSLDVNFRAYDNYGKLQRVVIATILGITDEELEELGLRNIPQLRGRAYNWMCKILNGEDLPIMKAHERRRNESELRGKGNRNIL